jgi:hypothetical protein
VLVTEQRFGLWSTDQLLQEQPHDVDIEEPITVFGVDDVGRRSYVVGCQIESPGLKPTNQRNSRL